MQCQKKIKQQKHIMFKKLSSKTDKRKFWKEARKNKKKNTLPTQDHR